MYQNVAYNLSVSLPPLFPRNIDRMCTFLLGLPYYLFSFTCITNAQKKGGVMQAMQ